MFNYYSLKYFLEYPIKTTQYKDILCNLNLHGVCGMFPIEVEYIEVLEDDANNEKCWQYSSASLKHFVNEQSGDLMKFEITIFYILTKGGVDVVG